ncbi:MAG: HPr family phosphocarrier protein [Clostridia bacterium]|nr:HPr family phosphocarrier protein [Clostridia bacterium]
MYTTHILLKNVAGAHAFVHLCDQMDCLVELVQGPFLIDGRSIIGILSLDLTSPIRAEVHSQTPEQTAFFAERVVPFAVETEAKA